MGWQGDTGQMYLWPKVRLLGWYGGGKSADTLGPLSRWLNGRFDEIASMAEARTILSIDLYEQVAGPVCEFKSTREVGEVRKLTGKTGFRTSFAVPMEVWRCRTTTEARDDYLHFVSQGLDAISSSLHQRQWSDNSREIADIIRQPVKELMVFDTRSMHRFEDSDKYNWDTIGRDAIY